MWGQVCGLTIAWVRIGMEVECLVSVRRRPTRRWASATMAQLTLKPITLGTSCTSPEVRKTGKAPGVRDELTPNLKKPPQYWQKIIGPVGYRSKKNVSEAGNEKLTVDRARFWCHGRSLGTQSMCESSHSGSPQVRGFLEAKKTILRRIGRSI